MKVLAVLFSVASFLFSCMVIMTDGFPREPAYVVFTMLLLMVPILTVFALVVAGVRRPLRRFTAATNVVLLGFVAWAAADQYPHPREAGFGPYVVLLIVASLLAVFALFRRDVGERRAEPAARTS